jgi:predicted oxidoreductase
MHSEWSSRTPRNYYWCDWLALISGPLIAVRLKVLTRKALGGPEADLNANVLRPD